MKVRLNKSEIKNFSKPFLVAEVGINHNGQLTKAFKMIEAAKAAGMDGVKFQTFKAREFVADKKQTYTYYSQGKKITESMLEMFERCEFSDDEWFKIKKKCDKEKIYFLSTPQNESDLESLLKLGIDGIKVGSDDLNNIPLLLSYAKTGLPLILSTGMSDKTEIDASLDAIGTFKGYPTIVLACTSEYPTPPQNANLNKITTLMKTYPGIPIGFSDHTQGKLAASLAVGFGACFFEKHFTLSHNLPGPDHWFSETPHSLKKWANAIRTSHILLGSPLLKPTATELKMKKIARRSPVAIQDIQKGNLFTLSNVALKRPATGLPPAFLKDIIGKKALKNIAIGKKISLKDFKK